MKDTISPATPSNIVMFDRVKPVRGAPAPEGFDQTSLLLMGSPSAALRPRARWRRSCRSASPTPMSASLSSGRSANFKRYSKISRGSPAKSPLRSQLPVRRPTPSRKPTLFNDAVFLEAASAKIRTAEAAAEGAAIAHQVFGAIGFHPGTHICTASRCACCPGETTSATKAIGRPSSANLSPAAAPTNSGRWLPRDDRQSAFDPIRLPPECEARSRRSARFPCGRDRSRHVRSAPCRARRFIQSRLQPPRRRQGLDRHDLAEAIRRTRAQPAGTLRRHRRVSRRQCAGTSALRRRPPERPDPAQICSRAHQERHPAAHLPRRIVLLRSA